MENKSHVPNHQPEMDRIVLVDLQEIQRHLHVFSLLPCLEGFLIPGQGSKKKHGAGDARTSKDHVLYKVMK